MKKNKNDYVLENQVMKALGEIPITGTLSDHINEYGEYIKVGEAPQEWLDKYVYHKSNIKSAMDLLAIPSYEIVSKLTKDGSLTISIFGGKIKGGDVIAPYTFDSKAEAWAWIDDFWEPLRNGKSNGSAAERAGDIRPFEDKDKKIRVKVSFDSMEDACDYYVETEHLRGEE